jgi:hypothetical protein
MNLVHLIPFYYLNIHSNIVLPYKPISSKLYPSLRFPAKMLHTYPFSTMRAAYSAHLNLFDLARVYEEGIMKNQVRPFSPASRYFHSLRSKHLPSTLCLNTLSIRSFKVRDQASYSCKTSNMIDVLNAICKHCVELLRYDIVHHASANLVRL